ncbi:HD domain-containing protein, partial [Vibrio sp. D173a]|uniref:HD domain-containing protein n=1 Tax=Vibrio sp. D173a TaxID=2836349 RepID=UPI002556613D
SGEHSWHVCISALMLKDYADEVINIDRVIKMLLIHDLGEIDAGDKIVYESETAEQKNKEWNGVKRVLDMLPNRQGEEYLALWEEFELGESADAKYAKAIDRIPPLLHNINDDGYGWKKHHVLKEKVLNFNQQRISAGGEKIWEGVEAKLQQAIVDGILT